MSRADRETPAPVTAEERWIVKHRVSAIRVEHRATGCDTSETYVHLKSFDGKTEACWRDYTFRKVADLKLSHAFIAEPAPGIREKVEARENWEKSNAAELAEYKRLHAKYGEPK